MRRDSQHRPKVVGILASPQFWPMLSQQRKFIKEPRDGDGRSIAGQQEGGDGPSRGQA